jgi:hypothetical protein
MPPTSDEESGGGDDSGSSGGGSRRKPPKEVSLTDPQAAWVTRKGIDPFFAYDANYLIDNKVGIIVDAEGTRANRTAEIAIAETMVERIKGRFGLRPQKLAGDSVYGAVRLLKWLVDRKITPHVPVWDKSARAIGRRDSSTTAPLRRCSPSATANSQPMAGLTPWKNPSPASASQGHRLLIAQRIGPSFRPSASDQVRRRLAP